MIYFKDQDGDLVLGPDKMNLMGFTIAACVEDGDTLEIQENSVNGLVDSPLGKFLLMSFDDVIEAGSTLTAISREEAQALYTAKD